VKNHPLRSALLAVLLVVGCDPDDGATCPPVEDARPFLESDTYRAPGGEPTNWYCSADDPCEAVFTPHEGASAIDVEMDLEAGRVTMRFERDGQMVVERWRITDRRFR